MRFLTSILMGAFLTLFLTAGCAEAANGKILFVPHDMRPISARQSAEVVEQLGYEVILPPREFYGDTKWNGEPDKILSWLENNVKSADAVVIASDTLLYGGLIPSRKHEESQKTINKRMARIGKIQAKHTDLGFYVFASLMRTPREVEPGFDEEPKYYETYGPQIFRLTGLLDKQEISGLSPEEQREMAKLQGEIPHEVWKDWMDRRKKNLAVTKKLMDMVRKGTLKSLVIGRDDNAPLCQTHRENRELLSYAEKLKLSGEKFQSLPGIDEFGLLLLTHAVNDLKGETPSIYTCYNQGVGAAVIPDYSDEQIGKSVDASVAIAGGKKADTPETADFVLLVNTDPAGRTYEMHNSLPNDYPELERQTLGRDTESFAALVDDSLAKGFPVGIADITFANGSDNELLRHLEENGQLYKLQAYGGWNTATNTTGFVIGTGLLAKNMDSDGKARLLTRRFLDDWAYQANVRTEIGRELYQQPDGGASYYSLGQELEETEQRTTKLMREFAAAHLPQFPWLKDFRVTFPWKRCFECEIHFSE